jgi:hypothetical protein
MSEIAIMHVKITAQLVGTLGCRLRNLLNAVGTFREQRTAQQQNKIFGTVVKIFLIFY